ncbi:hypothetical protein MMC18_007678 [Xylographa bjoerkii]|nr:hypothetical protein [Xylographa bjoerkii]
MPTSSRSFWYHASPALTILATGVPIRNAALYSQQISKASAAPGTAAAMDAVPWDITASMLIIRKSCSYSASSCCPSGSSCAPPAAQTIFKTNIEVQTAMVTQTDLQTTQDTVLVTGAGVTVQQTQTQTQTQIQTQAESFTIMQTVNAAGQTVQQTTIPIPPAAASSTSATSNPPSSPSNAGAIAGGAVGVTVVLAACALLLFVGVRKGWFDRKASTTDEKTAGDITQAPGGRAESFPSEMAAKKPRAAVVEIDRMTFGALGRPRVRSGVSSWLS